MSAAQDRMSRYFDKNWSYQHIKINQCVLLDGKNLNMCHNEFAETSKVAFRFVGSCKIVEKLSHDSNKLAMSNDVKIQIVRVHISLLKAYHKDESRQQSSSKVLLADEITEEQLVEAVIGR